MSLTRTFRGFLQGKSPMIKVPWAFFSELLPAIDDLVELKVTLYFFWALHQQEETYRYLLLREILGDARFLRGIDADSERAAEMVQAALARAVERGTLLEATVEGVAGPETLYFMNTPRGRAALQAIQVGAFEIGDRETPLALIGERTNLFTLYEQNIGPLTPLIGDILRQAEREYPSAWIKEAIQIAVEQNKRNWKYIEAILRRWQAEGKDRGTTKQPTQADRYRYIRGKYADHVEY